jgi:hypothetical protein
VIAPLSSTSQTRGMQVADPTAAFNVNNASEATGVAPALAGCPQSPGAARELTISGGAIVMASTTATHVKRGGVVLRS